MLSATEPEPTRPIRETVTWPHWVDGWDVISGVTDTLFKRDKLLDWDQALDLRDAILGAILDLHRKRTGSGTSS